MEALHQFLKFLYHLPFHSKNSCNFHSQKLWKDIKSFSLLSVGFFFFSFHSMERWEVYSDLAGTGKQNRASWPSFVPKYFPRFYTYLIVFIFPKFGKVGNGVGSCGKFSTSKYVILAYDTIIYRKRYLAMILD